MKLLKLIPFIILAIIVSSCGSTQYVAKAPESPQHNSNSKNFQNEEYTFNRLDLWKARSDF